MFRPRLTVRSKIAGKFTLLLVRAAFSSATFSIATSRMMAVPRPSPIAR